jgi:ribosomal protein S18 acetylase RimI-like enzyme
MRIWRLKEGDEALLAGAIKSLIPEEERDGKLASQSHLRQALSDESYYFIICLIDSTPAGYLSAFRFPNIDQDNLQVYLFEIEVGKPYRRKGIASGMIEELKGQCQADKVSLIWIGTDLANTAAQRTFEKAGAERIQETYIEYNINLD